MHLHSLSAGTKIIPQYSIEDYLSIRIFSCDQRDIIIYSNDKIVLFDFYFSDMLQASLIDLEQQENNVSPPVPPPRVSSSPIQARKQVDQVQ